MKKILKKKTITSIKFLEIDCTEECYEKFLEVICSNIDDKKPLQKLQINHQTPSVFGNLVSKCRFLQDLIFRFNPDWEKNDYRKIEFFRDVMIKNPPIQRIYFSKLYMDEK